MTVDELRRSLTNQFDLVCFEDLGTLRAKHRSVFDLFQSVKQDAYKPNQRLVLYTSHDPEQLLLDHVQRAAATVDISNYFIIIVCPYDINARLKQSNQDFGHDNVTIGALMQPITGTAAWGESGIAHSRYLCPLPFAMITVNHAATARPCCKFRDALGDVRNTSLDDVFQNQGFRDIRSQMIQGEPVSQCKICWQAEEQGTTSLRQLALAKYGDLLDQEWLDDPQIRDLSWSPASLCNFACRICSPKNSTKIAVESISHSSDAALIQNLQNWIKISNNDDLQVAIIDDAAQLSHLNFLHILGGEPLLWPKLSYLVERLIDNGTSKNIRLEINTNGSVFPGSLLDVMIDNFKFVEILLSIDNVGDRFELERGGNWPEVLANIKSFAALRSHKVQIKLAPTVNLQNVLYLDDVAALAHDMGLEIVWWYLHEPKFLCIDAATPALKNLVNSKYSTHPESELRKIAQRLCASPGSTGQEFIAYVHKMDAMRGQRFQDTHAEVYQAIVVADHQITHYT